MDEQVGAGLPAVVTSREAHACGRRADLRGGYRRVAPNVHLVLGADVDDPDIRSAVAMAATPASATLGGWAAARVHEKRALRSTTGLVDERERFVDGCGPDGPRPVLVLVPPEVRLGPLRGRRALRSRVDEREREVVDGLTVTSPLRTAFDVARLDPTEEAVVTLDRLRALGLVDPADVDELLRRRAGWLGVRAGRRAVASSASGVESPQETRMRLAWCDAGVPVPVCNPVVRGPDGRFVARVDLLDPVSGLVGEYDGAVHASAGRRSADAARQERLEALGMVVVRATAVDLAGPGSRARWQQRLRAAHRRAATTGSRSTWTAA